MCWSLTGLAIIYFRPEIFLQGGSHVLEATVNIEDAIGILFLTVGWIGIFDYFIRYRSDRLVALNSQLKSLLKATSLATFWLMVDQRGVHGEELQPAQHPDLLHRRHRHRDRQPAVSPRPAAERAANRDTTTATCWLSEPTNAPANWSAQIEEKPELGYKIAGFVAETAEAEQAWSHPERPDWRIPGRLENLREILSRERVDEIIVCLPMDARFSDIALIVRNARDLGIVVRLMPELADGTLLRNLHVEEFEDELHCHAVPGAVAGAVADEAAGRRRRFRSSC